MMQNGSKYKSVLKATTMLGGSSLFRIFMEMVRRKIVAVLLGPSGVGLLGVYQSIENLAGTFVEMGVRTSGVRQIAMSYGAGDELGTGRLVSSLRTLVCVMALIGGVAVALSSPIVTRLTFGSSDHLCPIAFLGLCVLINELIVGQSCIIQGCRRVGSIALMTMIGSINGTVLSVPILYFWGVDGIVPSLIIVALASYITNWHFARKICLPHVKVDVQKKLEDAKKLLGLGIPIMFSALLGALSAYVVRLLLIRHFDMHGVGLWTAAFAFSGGLVSFILGAMTADYYPRLSAIAGDVGQVAEVLNVQTEVAILLALPALAATMLFAPFGIWLFYDGRFDGAVIILRWSVYGVFGRLLGWPLGYVLLAQGRSKMFFLTELLVSVTYLVCLELGCRCWGLEGSGIAFMINYGVYVPLMLVVMRMSGVRAWNKRIVVLVLLGIGVLLMSRLIYMMSNDVVRYFLSFGFVLLTGLFSISQLERCVGYSVFHKGQSFISKLRNIMKPNRK